MNSYSREKTTKMMPFLLLVAVIVIIAPTCTPFTTIPVVETRRTIPTAATATATASRRTRIGERGNEEGGRRKPSLSLRNRSAAILTTLRSSVLHTTTTTNTNSSSSVLHHIIPPAITNSVLLSPLAVEHHQYHDAATTPAVTTHHRHEENTEQHRQHQLHHHLHHQQHHQQHSHSHATPAAATAETRTTKLVFHDPLSSSLNHQNKNNQFIFHYPPKSMEESDWIRNVHKTEHAIATQPTMNELKSWGFNPLLYKEDALTNVFVDIIQHFGYDEKYNIPVGVLHDFSKEVQNRYRKDPAYHNYYHAVSVLHITFMFLTDGEASDYLTDLDIFALLFSAIIHDVDHRGNNNEYEINTNTTLGLKYFDSILERNSLDVTWDEILTKSNCNILADDEAMISSSSSSTEIKDLITEIVLHTDVPGYHSKFSQRLAQRIQEAELTKAANNATMGSSPYLRSIMTEPVKYFDKSNSNHRSMLCCAIIKAADISNPILSDLSAVRDWSMRISMEFKNQVDKERTIHKIPYSKVMDVTNEYDVSKLQYTFYTKLVLPYYKLIGDVLPKTKFLLQNANKNLLYFQEYCTWVETHKEDSMRIK